MSLPGNPHKFSYMNYVGEKLFTRDTNTTRLSIGDTETTPDKSPTKNTAPQQDDLPIKPPKPELRPKPAIIKPKPKLEGKTSGGSSGGSPTNSRTEFKTLSMISNETSIWGSTSSAGTFKQDDEAPSPLSCHTPTEQDEQEDVFTTEEESMTSSFSLKHQQMVSSCV